VLSGSRLAEGIHCRHEGGREDLERVTARYAQYVEYNPERELLQVLNCMGSVVAQFDVSNRGLAALELRVYAPCDSLARR
jgi:hypothetical protein